MANVQGAYALVDPNKVIKPLATNTAANTDYAKLIKDAIASNDQNALNTNLAARQNKIETMGLSGSVQSNDDLLKSLGYTGQNNNQTTDNSGLINGEYANLVSALRGQIQQSINNKKQELNNLDQKYVPQRDASEVQKANDLKVALEQSANAGDRGGIGRQNALETQTAGENRLNSLNLQENTEKSALQNDIANLVMEGNVQEANISAQKLKDLIANKQYVDTTNYNRNQDALNRKDRLDQQQWERDLATSDREWAQNKDNPVVRAQILDNQMKELELDAQRNPNSPENQMKRLQVQQIRQSITNGSISADRAKWELNNMKSGLNPDGSVRSDKPDSLDYQYKKAQIDALQGKGQLQYKDYVSMGRDLLDKGNYDSTLKQYVKIYNPVDVKNWISGLPLTPQEKASLANDLGIPKG